MIKKIPIKGISRDPSGQIASDGYCAESLNVQLDMGEVAPAMRPKAVTDASGNGVSVQGDILFIHKGVSYENLVYRDGTDIHFTATLPKGTARTGIVYSGLLADEEVYGVTAIGNTLVVSTSKDMYYILWKEGAYRFLGNRIPVPDIHFRIGNLAGRRIDVAPIAIDEDSAADFYSQEGISGFPWQKDNSPAFNHETAGDKTEYGSAAKHYAFDYNDNDGLWVEYMNAVWSTIDGVVASAASAGKAVFPVFVRYAVRLYDGTSYSQSIPVLLGADIEKFICVQGIAIQDYNPNDGEVALMVMTALARSAEAYSIVMDVADTSVFSGWEDIVTGVDLFISPQIKPVQRNAAKVTVKYVAEGWSVGNITANLFEIGVDVDPYYAKENQDKMILYYQATYLAKSFTVNEFSSLSSDVLLEDINFNSDYIMAQEGLKETPQSMHHTIGSRLFNYNKRLLVADAEQYLSHGYPFLHSVKWSTLGQYGGMRYRFVYHLRGENGENIVICRDENGNAQITPKNGAIVNDSPDIFYEVPCAWLSYPDSRCYQIDVYQLEGQSVKMSSFKTKVFDQADVAFVFFGFGKQVNATASVQAAPSNEELTYKMPNTLVVSKPNNPFVFPATDAVTFTAGEIINLAVATKPLSEGQFGQFPLYVFTDEGVFALSVDSEGKFQTNHPVTRDILLNKDSLAGIEQGVFFAAARGLLLLQGSSVTKVSTVMDGHPTELDRDFASEISTQFLGGLEVESPQQFYKFLADCRLVYDYANSRIILLNPDSKTQYVYKFDTQSWHRLSIGNSYPVRALNSYPEAQVVMQAGSRQSVLDFSVIAEDEDAQALPGLVYTRDLSLDSADIYKTIHRLKVRGRFKDGHVKWQLQGSNDGMNYKTVHSLRGPSWKWYRIALVTLLDPEERVSFIELDCEPRFTNKVR